MPSNSAMDDVGFNCSTWCESFFFLALGLCNHDRDTRPEPVVEDAADEEAGHVERAFLDSELDVFPDRVCTIAAFSQEPD